MKTKRIMAGSLVLGLGLMSLAAQGGDVESGRDTAGRLCARCHGPEGISDNTLMPNLAGQNKDYLIQQLHNYKDRLRRSVAMRQVARDLSDADIKNVAAYYASLRNR